MTIKEIFDRLWQEYTFQNPHAGEIYNLFVNQGEVVMNDHIAFRTFNDHRVNIDVLSKLFLDAGYVYKNDYHFENKHLYAKHYEYIEDKNAPRVFISELILEDFSDFLQETAREAISKIPKETLKEEHLIFSGNSWGTPSHDIYIKLREESEYAAWLYVHGFRANHFTVSVNSLKKLDTLQKVNSFVKDNGFLLNDADGEIKGTPSQMLEQSSTKAGLVDYNFEEGTFIIPACYYEFARRYHDENNNLYSGFIAQSADKIFESTDFYTED